MVAGGAVAIAVSTRTDDENVTCPPPVRRPGVIVSATKPLPGTGPSGDDRPLAFVVNRGQVDPKVRYYAIGEAFSVYVTDDAIVIAPATGGPQHAFRLVPRDPSSTAFVEAHDPLPGRTTYFVRGQRFADLRSYGQVAYRDLWPGIDLVLRVRAGALKYEFEVAPGADPARIRLAYRDVAGVALASDGGLIVSTAVGPLRDARPATYQVGATHDAVASAYVVDERTATFGFDIGQYDRGRPLVIDPGIEYSLYLGGSGTDFARAVVVDGDGNTYVAGGAQSADFPVTPNAPGTTYRGQPDAFVAKLDRAGAILYATYIAGSGSETALSLAVDRAGSAYVSGGSNSDDFPTTPGAFEPRHKRNEDAWVVKLDPTGSKLVYATFLTGSAISGDFANALAVDDSGHAYVAGGTGSPDFPTTRGALDRTHGGKVNELDGFLAKLTPDGSRLVFSTYVGGTCYDAINGIALGPSGQAYVVGSSASSDFRTTSRAVGRRYHGGEDAFVARVSSDGAHLEYSTFLGGGNFDTAKSIAIGRDGSMYVTGWTKSRSFPATPRAYDTQANGREDGFVTKLAGDGSRLRYSTYLGGTAMEESWSIAVDGKGRAYVAGVTASPTFPTTPGAVSEQPRGGQDAFLTAVAPDGTRLEYSTYLGGSDVDIARAITLADDRTVYVVGRTSSPNFPTSGSRGTALAGDRDGFVARLYVR